MGFMSKEEQDKRNIERTLERINLEIALLECDLKLVQSDKSVELINSELKSLYHRKDRKSFELWKLTRE